jgi:hypothetical protein
MNKSDLIWTKIAELIQNIQVTIQRSTEAISSVDTDLNVLAINARIQAARIGTAGAGIKVVADRMEAMIEQTKSITDDLNLRIGKTMKDLTQLKIYMESRTRGFRLAQIAASCIDLIDRNLYERSCDVRFWATDAVIVKALETLDEENLTNASHRLGVILQSYTVYCDIVLCGLDGTVVCNGRSDIYHSRAAQVKNCEWYTQACRSANGGDFGFEGPLRSALINDRLTMIYSCGVRSGGNPNGKLVGVLAVLFNWEKLGATVLRQAKESLLLETDNPLRVFLCRSDGKIIATHGEDDRSDIDTQETYDTIVPVSLQILRASQDGFHFYNESGRDPVLIGLGSSRGYETYATGWLAVITETFRR